MLLAAAAWLGLAYRRSRVHSRSFPQSPTCPVGFSLSAHLKLRRSDMASDVLVDTALPPSPHTRSPSLSSDNDDVNTSDARVYFGPFQDAEKKFARLSDPNQHTPVRTSLQFSLVPRTSNATASSSDDEDGDNKEDTDASADPDAQSFDKADILTTLDDTAEGACVTHASLITVHTAKQ